MSKESKLDLLKITDLIDELLVEEGFKRIEDSNHFNKVMYYKALYIRYDRYVRKNIRIHVNLYYNGSFTFQGNVSKEYRDKLAASIWDKIRGATQLTLFSEVN